MNWCFPWYLPSLCSFCIFKCLVLISLQSRKIHKSSWVPHQEEYGLEDEKIINFRIYWDLFYVFPELYTLLSLSWSAIPQKQNLPDISILHVLDVYSSVSLKLVLFSSWGSFPLMNSNWPMKNLSGWGLLVSSSAGTFKASIIISLHISLAHFCLGSELTLHRKSTYYYYLLITDKYQNLTITVGFMQHNCSKLR